MDEDIKRDAEVYKGTLPAGNPQVIDLKNPDCPEFTFRAFAGTPQQPENCDWFCGKYTRSMIIDCAWMPDGVGCVCVRYACN